VNNNLGGIHGLEHASSGSCELQTLKERVSAGYVMNTIDFNSRIRVVAGRTL